MGETIWEEEFDDGFYASPIIAGTHVFALDLKGVMHIFEVGATYKAIGTCELGEASSCTPAVLKNRIYMRGNKNLYCIATK